MPEGGGTGIGLRLVYAVGERWPDRAVRSDARDRVPWEGGSAFGLPSRSIATMPADVSVEICSTLQRHPGQVRAYTSGERFLSDRHVTEFPIAGRGGSPTENYPRSRAATQGRRTLWISQRIGGGPTRWCPRSCARRPAMTEPASCRRRSGSTSTRRRNRTSPGLDKKQTVPKRARSGGPYRRPVLRRSAREGLAVTSVIDRRRRRRVKGD